MRQSQGNTIIDGALTINGRQTMIGALVEASSLMGD
jgi:hypothetical protein